MTAQLVARKAMLNGRKTERIIFAVIPELKKAVAKAVKDKYVSVSAYRQREFVNSELTNLRARTNWTAVPSA